MSADGHSTKEIVVDGISSLDEPSVEWGWHKHSAKVGWATGGFFVLFLLAMLFGNHVGNVENLWLVGVAAFLAIWMIIALRPKKDTYAKSRVFEVPSDHYLRWGRHRRVDHRGPHELTPELTRRGEAAPCTGEGGFAVLGWSGDTAPHHGPRSRHPSAANCRRPRRSPGPRIADRTGDSGRTDRVDERVLLGPGARVPLAARVGLSGITHGPSGRDAVRGDGRASRLQIWSLTSRIKAYSIDTGAPWSPRSGAASMTR